MYLIPPLSKTQKIKKLFFLGLARSLLSTCTYLKKYHDTELWAWDDEEQSRQAVKNQGLALTKEHIPWKTFDAMVLSPGIPSYGPKQHPLVKEALKHNLPLISDIELFFRLYGTAHIPLIAISGSNGKSTVTALVQKLLGSLGFSAFQTGNNGIPIFQTLDHLQENLGKNLAQTSSEKIFSTQTHRQNHEKKSEQPLEAFQEFLSQTVFVLEISSFQLELTPSLKPWVAILTNVVPDHLDRHGSFKAYCQVKYSLLSVDARNVLGITNNRNLQFYQKCQKNLTPHIFTVGPFGHLEVKNNGLNVSFSPTQEQGSFLKFIEHLPNPVVSWPQTPFGILPHNRENIGLSLGGIMSFFHVLQTKKTPLKEKISLPLSSHNMEIIQKTLNDFSGLPHRQEEIYTEEFLFPPNSSTKEENFLLHRCITLFNNVHCENNTQNTKKNTKINPGLVGHIRYINDSKATNLASSALTLNSLMSEKIFWIFGGVPKSSSLEEVARCLPFVSWAFLIGQSQKAYRAECLKYNLKAFECGCLSVAFHQARREALFLIENKKKSLNLLQEKLWADPFFQFFSKKQQPQSQEHWGELFDKKDTGLITQHLDQHYNHDNFLNSLCIPLKIAIVLSPGCTSFDQFKNFEDRGNTFRTLTQAILQKNKE